MKKGIYNSKILRINLSEKEIQEETISDEVLYNFIGGRGLGVKLLWDEVASNVKPLSPNNKLILSIGPFTGTAIPTSSRVVASTKSPLTNTYMYSIAGGAFGHHLGKLGYNAIIIEGKANKPIYLNIGQKE